MADYLMKAMSKGMHCSGVMKGSNAEVITYVNDAMRDVICHSF